MDNRSEIMGVDGEPLELLNGGKGIYLNDGRFLPDLHYAIHSVYKSLYYGYCQPAEAIARTHALAEYVFSGTADERLIEVLASHARNDLENRLPGAEDPYFQGIAKALFKIGFDNFRSPLAESAAALSEASGLALERHQYSEPPSDDLENPIDKIFDSLDTIMGGDTYEALRRIKPLADCICAGLEPDDLMDFLSRLDEDGIRLVAEMIAECADGKNLVGMADGRARIAYAQLKNGGEPDGEDDNWGSEEDIKQYLESANISEETYDEVSNFLADMFPTLGFTKPHREEGDGINAEPGGQEQPKSGGELYGLYKAYEGKGIDLAMLDKSIFYLYEELECFMKPEDAVIISCEIIQQLSSGCVPPEFARKLAGFAMSSDNGEFDRHDNRSNRNPFHEICKELMERGIPRKLESASPWGIANGIAGIISTQVDFDIESDFDKPPFKEAIKVGERINIHSGNDYLTGVTFDRDDYNVFDGLLEAICFDEPGGEGEQGMCYSDGLIRLKELAEYCGACLCEYDFYRELNLYFGNSRAHEDHETFGEEKFKEAVRILKDREPCQTDGAIMRLYECMMGKPYRMAERLTDVAGEGIVSGIFSPYAGLGERIEKKADESIRMMQSFCANNYYFDISSLGICALYEYIASGMASDEFITKLAKLADLPTDERNALLEKMAKEIMFKDYGIKSFYGSFFDALYESAGFEPDKNNDPVRCSKAIDDLDEAYGQNMGWSILDECVMDVGLEENGGLSLGEKLFKLKPFYETSVYGLIPGNILERIYVELYGLRGANNDKHEIARAIADCPAGENPCARVAKCLGFMPYGHIIEADEASQEPTHDVNERPIARGRGR